MRRIYQSALPETSSNVKCIYCFQEKEPSDFTVEHIFPDALGGNLCGAAFETTRVCQRCNTLSGLFIDGVFLRSWLCHNYNFTSALQYLDWQNGSAIPLLFLGLLNNLSTEKEICEYWSGPCGEHIYHFHSRDDIRFNAYVKGDPIRRKKDPGYAIIFGTTNHQNWAKISLLSFRRQFREAQRYSGNFQIPDEASRRHFFHDPTPQIVSRIAQIAAITNNERQIEVIWQTTMDQRFFSKLALGFGFKLIGEEFLDSDYARTVQRALWEPDVEKRRQYKVRGKGFLGGSNSLRKILSWDGGHVLFFKADNEFLSLSLFLFGTFEGHIMISDLPALRRGKTAIIDEDGWIYLTIPQRDVCVGPISLPAYLAHKQGIHRIPSLASIEAMRIDVNSLPPCK